MSGRLVVRYRPLRLMVGCAGGEHTQYSSDLTRPRLDRRSDWVKTCHSIYAVVEFGLRNQPRNPIGKTNGMINPDSAIQAKTRRCFW